MITLVVKVTASPAQDDARHLLWLHDQLQDRFSAGAVPRTGPRPLDLDDRIRALHLRAVGLTGPNTPRRPHADGGEAASSRER